MHALHPKIEKVASHNTDRTGQDTVLVTGKMNHSLTMRNHSDLYVVSP